MRRGYLALMRPTNCTMIGFAVIVGAGIAAGRELLSVDVIRLASGFIVGFSFCAVSMTVNDIYDIEIDRVNKLDRPLATGKATVPGAYKLSSALAIIGLLFSTLTGLLTFIIASFSLAVGVYYNAKGKKLGLPGNIMVAYNIGIPILYGALIVERLTWTIMIYWLMVFLAGLGREIVKDIADIEGDKVKGVKSLPITYGEKLSSMLAVVMYLIAILLSPFPLTSGHINRLGYGVPVLVTDILLLYSIVIIVKSPDRVHALKHKKIVLIGMLSGLIGFLLGNL
ncbi:MAG: UbiA family prenyltransferase [Desulfurococcales archaeon]|nr:UbiA family prenyltransferase [Desulfurococcales archaeon]